MCIRDSRIAIHMLDVEEEERRGREEQEQRSQRSLPMLLVLVATKRRLATSYLILTLLMFPESYFLLPTLRFTFSMDEGRYVG